jgi:PDGLE domain
VSRLTKRNKGFLLVGLLVALLLAGVASYYASNSPDGLNKVAADKGFDAGAKGHTADGSPLAGYSTKGVDDGRLSGGLAGVAGVGITFLIAGAVVLAVRRRDSSPADRARDDDLTSHRP